MTPATKSLDELLAACQDQIERFRRGQDRDSSSCDEIVRRAAARDEAALETLLVISLPLIAKSCPAALRTHVDDVQQVVSYRLMQKFRSIDSPYRASTFAAYRTYLTKTISSVSFTLLKRERQYQSLDRMGDESGSVPTQRSDTALVEAQLCLERCLVLLTDPLTREVFRRRFVLSESPDEIVAALHAQGQTVTKKDVFRLTERSILYLSKLPEVRDMFESDAGNDD